MVTIVDNKPDPSVVKQIICKHCGVKLEYTPNDEKREYATDYLGDRVYYNYITCPNCSEQMKTRST